MYKLIVMFALLAISCQVLTKPYSGMVQGFGSKDDILIGNLNFEALNKALVDAQRLGFERNETDVRVIRASQGKSQSAIRDSQSSESSSSDESLPTIESPESIESVESPESPESSESSESRENRH